VKTVNIVFKSLYACAHQCGFCHVLHVPRNTSYMPTDQVKATFDDIERMFAGQRVEMEMSGGEFTMRKDAVELIEYLRTKNIHWSSLVLDTMGVFLANDHLARSLGTLFDKANVSVHACDADLHVAVSSSSTRFENLEAGIRNLFRFFPAVFTNTSINKFNYNRLSDIARFILRARESMPGRPLYCLFYLPVYREYGGATKENLFRIQGQDNADFVPDAQALPQVRAEFANARALLAQHGVPAILRDFNMPACIYHAVSGSFPENAFGLPNFMTDCYFTDFAHPIAERHTLEVVYPSKYRRTKERGCGNCILEDSCPGIPEVWTQRGYHVQPIDAFEYTETFPIQLLNQTLFGIFHDAVRMKRVLSGFRIEWGALAHSYFTSLSAGTANIREARMRIAALSPVDRSQRLAHHLRTRTADDSPALAGLIEEEMAALLEPSWSN
jgi:MoaA/NifB/PqqE/SkfB family radical SAM enzyme